jgi:hypothetical protein
MIKIESIFCSYEIRIPVTGFEYGRTCLEKNINRNCLHLFVFFDMLLVQKIVTQILLDIRSFSWKWRKHLNFESCYCVVSYTIRIFITAHLQGLKCAERSKRYSSCRKMNLEHSGVLSLRQIIQCVRKVAVHLGVWVAISRRGIFGPCTSLPTTFLFAQRLSERRSAESVYE